MCYTKGPGMGGPLRVCAVVARMLAQVTPPSLIRKPIYPFLSRDPYFAHKKPYRGTSLIRKAPPPMITVGP